ncbi:MAG: sulfatase-like hydrolase/transferase, partial [Planctomycetes bacterium]|nr:sulfatase-like hydrolase/transferase [Planctomycetota bacterium]
TSDNGPHTEGGHNPEYFNSSGSQRGTKRDLYEGGIHVPMIAWWPEKIPAESTTNHLSAFWDVLPTIADIVGHKKPDNIDGISFLPTLLGENGQKQHDYLYWEFHEKKGRVALRLENWKAVRYNVALNAKSPLELYNLAKDPSESNDISQKFPKIVSIMEALIQGARTESPVANFNFPLKKKKDKTAMAHEK